MALRKGQTVEQNDTPETEAVTQVEEPSTTQAAGDDIPPFETKEVEQEPVKAVQEEKQAEAPASQEVAAASGNMPVKSADKMAQDFADQGFEGIQTKGYGLFPMIALKTEGHFESSEGWDLGDEFHCVILGTKKKYVLKNTRCEKRDEDTVFSYDLVTEANSGRSLDEIKQEWAEKSWGCDVKEYLEASAMMMSGDHAGEPVLLSIPPTSKGRFSSMSIREQMKAKQMPNEYVTRCSVGEKVTKVDFPFYPWSFERSKDYSLDDL